MDRKEGRKETRQAGRGREEENKDDYRGRRNSIAVMNDVSLTRSEKEEKVCLCRTFNDDHLCFRSRGRFNIKLLKSKETYHII